MDVLRNPNSFSRRERAEKPVPSEGAGRYFSLLYMHFWKLVGLNLLFIAFSLPVVTMPAALCGINRVCIKLIREGNVFVWDEFIKEFKASLLKSIPFGLLFSILLFISYYFLSIGISNQQSIYGVFFSALGLAAVFACFALSSYVFVLIPMLSLKNSDIFKNARALMTLNSGRTLSVIGIELSAAFIAWLLFPISAFLLAVCLFSLVEFTVCFIINTPVQKYVIGPYEEKLAEKEMRT